MSLLEVLVSISVLVIGLAGFLQTIVTTSSMESTTSEHAAAAAAARATLENMRSTTFSEVFARYNAFADDDLPTGASPGAFFAIDGLREMPGAPAGQVGEIVMPVHPNTPGVLREDLVAETLDLPADLDLNADGDLIDVDNTLDYRLLPVVVRVRWESRRGPQVFELRTILGELQ